MKSRTAFLSFAVSAVLLLGGCGGGEGGSDDAAADGTTVAVASAEGVGDVLVDADGSALYASEQERDGTVRCVDACAAIWLPLTVDGEPSAGDELDARLGVVERPDGTRQVTFGGMPLYSFIEDSKDGVVTGNGLSDDFDGQEFTWHVVTPEGVSTTDENSEKPDPRDEYSGGGYGR